MIDYLIVGSGIAGISFAETCIQKGKRFFVLENNSQNSSFVAGGLYNPVILKRFSKVENAQEQLTLLNSFYASVEERIQSKVNFPLPLLRKFISIEEQNNWFIASDKIGLSPFLSTHLLSRQYEGIDAPYGYGEVLQTGYVDTTVLLDGFRNYLTENSLIEYETFDYSQLEVTPDSIRYKTIEARNIVFAEGFGMHSNPYFRHLPLDGTKGELLIIKAPALRLDVIVNTSVFILPLGNGLFKVGATYNWADKTDKPTEEGRQELVSRIKEILNCDFEIVEHLAGVRPTVKDRKSLIGTHPDYKNVHVLNGLGTRGVMLGPSMALALYKHIENGVPLDLSCDIKRFNKKK